MSLLYFIIFVILAVRFIQNLKQTLLLYAPYKLILHSGIFLIDSNILVNLDLAISAYACIIYFSEKYIFSKKIILSKRLVKSSERIPYILQIGFYTYLLALFIHSIKPGFKPTLFFPELVCTFLYGYILYRKIHTKEDISKLYRGFVVVALILFVDGLIDIVFGVNIITLIEKSQAGSRFLLSTNDMTRAGLARTTSFMPHSISMGSLASLLFGFLYMIGVHGRISKNKIILYIVLLLLVLCVIYSNSRTPILALICFSPLFISLKFNITPKVIFLLLGLVTLIIIYSDYLLWMYNSVVNESKVDVQGSTSDLRLNQFDIALYWMLRNPLFGQGNNFQLLLHENSRYVAGMESEWFPIMIQQGLWGVTAYVILLISIIVFFFRNGMFNHILFVLAWVVVISLSSQMGLSMYMLILFPLITYKIKLLRKV